MTLKFGRTWWGEHWLRSLENVDYDNRLPRGASYARNGYEKDAGIKGNQIASKVAGSRPRPYNSTIIVPPYFEEQIDGLMDDIIMRPALISKLLNRELDPEIPTIADDMGLGKTLQVISMILKLKEEGAIDQKHRALAVVPTGLLTNWKAEIEKFAPSISTHIFHGSALDIKQFDADLMLTTYGVLRSDHQLLRKQKWQIMVIDEAQNIKNHDTAQSKAIKSIPANIRIAMSGTPVENRLSEFWSIMEFTNKGYLGNIQSFKKSFADPIQVFNDERTVSKFRKVTSPFMMRRMKSDKRKM